jgi:hypothetical protein
MLGVAPKAVPGPICHALWQIPRNENGTLLLKIRESLNAFLTVQLEIAEATRRPIFVLDVVARR